MIALRHVAIGSRATSGTDVQALAAYGTRPGPKDTCTLQPCFARRSGSESSRSKQPFQCTMRRFPSSSDTWCVQNYCEYASFGINSCRKHRRSRRIYLSSEKMKGRGEEMLAQFCKRKMHQASNQGIRSSGAAHSCDGGACRILDGVSSLPAPSLIPLE